MVGDIAISRTRSASKTPASVEEEGGTASRCEVGQRRRGLGDRRASGSLGDNGKAKGSNDILFSRSAYYIAIAMSQGRAARVRAQKERVSPPGILCQFTQTSTSLSRVVDDLKRLSAGPTKEDLTAAVHGQSAHGSVAMVSSMTGARAAKKISRHLPWPPRSKLPKRREAPSPVATSEPVVRPKK